MASLNKLLIIGNLGADPELRQNPEGKPVTSFPVATNRVFTSQEGERQQETEWFTVVAWGKLAEQCNQFLAKSKTIYAEGRLRLKTWEGNDGRTHYMNEIIATKVIFLDKDKHNGEEEAREY